jgi:hypothetical protein
MFDLGELHDHELFGLDDIATQHDGEITALSALQMICSEESFLDHPASSLKRIHALADAIFDLPPAARGPLVKAELLTRGLLSSQ